MMIKYTEKLETNIKSELHEETKLKHKTKQNKNVLQKYFPKIAMVTIRTFTCDSPSYQ